MLTGISFPTFDTFFGSDSFATGLPFGFGAQDWDMLTPDEQAQYLRSIGAQPTGTDTGAGSGVCGVGGRSTRAGRRAMREGGGQQARGTNRCRINLVQEEDKYVLIAEVPGLSSTHSFTFFNTKAYWLLITSFSLTQTFLFSGCVYLWVCVSQP